ncbi:MAG: NfeD family protein [Pseudomonadota bacterium]
MTDSTIWWLFAGGAVIAELLTGTFFLLMVAFGMAAGALAAHAGAGLVTQIAVAAVTGGGAVVMLYLIKRRWPTDATPRADRSAVLDIGELLTIDAWAVDGTASVKYRGANWTVIHRPGHEPSPGRYRVTEVVGNRLLVEPVQS